jgi:hypothetical protein
MVKPKKVTVYDRMQRGYRYVLGVPMGRNFDPEFRPELTPKEMLELGVFCGKYMTDCQNEFPATWFRRARLSPSGRDCSLNYFGVDASQPLSVWRQKGWIHPARLVPVVLPLLHGAPTGRGGCTPDQALESNPPPHCTDQAALRARRPDVPAAPAPSVAALGL